MATPELTMNLPIKNSAIDIMAKDQRIIRVLHTDKDASFGKISKSALEAKGAFHVDNVTSVEEACEELKQQTYDVIVSGYNFPEKDGLQFLKQLRQTGNPVPFILFTVKGRAEVAVDAVKLGADGYVNKIGDGEAVFGELSYSIHQAVEKKRTIEALKKSELELKALFESSPDLIMVIDRSYRFVRMNHTPYTNLKDDQLIGQDSIDPLPPDQRDFVKNAIDLCFSTGAAQEIQHTMGSGQWVQARIVPLWANGFVNQIMIIATDITKTKLAENRMRQEMEQGSFRLELYTKALHLTEKELYSYFLAQATQRTGSTIGFFHFVSEDQKTIILTVWNDEAMKSCSANYNTHYSIEKAGNWVDCVRLKRPILYNDFPNSPNQKGLPPGHVPIRRFMSIPIIEDDKVRIIFGVGNKTELYEEADAIQLQIVANELHKILKHRRLEAALRESEEKYRSQFEEAMDAIILAKAETGIIVDCNSSACKLVDKNKSEIIGTSFADLHPADSHAEERQRLFMQHLKSENQQVLEDVVVTKSGELKPVEIKASSFCLGDEAFIQSIIRDVTERKQAEETLNEIMASLVLVNEKLGMVGSLTRHDVRNKLTIIKGNMYLAKKNENNTDITQYLNDVENVVTQTLSILDFTQTYEQIGIEKLVPMDAGKAFNEAVQLSSNLNNVTISNECNGVIVMADSLFRQLFYNLIDNSLKHNKTANQIRLYCKKTEPEQLNLIYEDNGEGIPNELKSKIFQEGFSTGKGSGYGLFLIKKIVEVYGWSITENGEFGKGARFIITVPAQVSY